MALTLPENMEELVYFTRRLLDGKRIICWVDKQPCAHCGKGLMSKPKDPKTGRPKIRATEYICEYCDHKEPKQEYEDGLTALAVYTCPHCEKDGESSAPFKRKTIKGVKTLRLQCEHCGGNLDLTKKMKEPKNKKK